MARSSVSRLARLLVSVLVAVALPLIHQPLHVGFTDELGEQNYTLAFREKSKRYTSYGILA